MVRRCTMRPSRNIRNDQTTDQYSLAMLPSAASARSQPGGFESCLPTSRKYLLAGWLV